MFGDITDPRSSNAMLDEFHGLFTVRWNASSPEHQLKHGPPIPSISNVVMALTILHAQSFKVVGRQDRPPVADGYVKVDDAAELAVGEYQSLDRIETEVGYGFSAFGGRFTQTPYLGYGDAAGNRNLRWAGDSRHRRDRLRPRLRQSGGRTSSAVSTMALICSPLHDGEGRRETGTEPLCDFPVLQLGLGILQFAVNSCCNCLVSPSPQRPLHDECKRPKR